uniref:Reverse transcriptase domain-containing protein n=1 Tax=Callorhinchus milii TaxID=7868 RepID=A0A4W3GZ76_CALMI
MNPIHCFPHILLYSSCSIPLKCYDLSLKSLEAKHSILLTLYHFNLPFHSGFRAAHSTETALLKVTNDILSICDQGFLCLLVLLDFSAAFHTVNHTILIHCLSPHLNLHSSVLDWFRSYLSHRQHFISTIGFSSSPRTVSCGVPQGSVLGPLLFNIYMLPLDDIIRRHGVNFHMYAEDTQLYLSASTLDSRTTAVLTECLSGFKSWMRANFLQLNINKTEALLLGFRQHLLTSGADGITIHGFTLDLANPVWNLGVLFASQLSLLPHIWAMTRSAFPHLRNVARLRHCLTPQATETLIHAFITSKLNYACHSPIPPSIGCRSSRTLQPVSSPPPGSATLSPPSSLASHHTEDAVQDSGPHLPSPPRSCSPYLYDLVTPYHPAPSLRSVGSGLPHIPRLAHPTIGGRAYCHS